MEDQYNGSTTIGKGEIDLLNNQKAPEVTSRGHVII